MTMPPPPYDADNVKGGTPNSGKAWFWKSIVWLLIVCGVVSAVSCTIGQVRQALAHDSGPHAEWFQSLTIPGTVASCCNMHDCAPTQDYRTRDGVYEVLHQGRWLPVPPERVLVRRDNPTGQAVACILAGAVVCFVPGTEI